MNSCTLIKKVNNVSQSIININIIILIFIYQINIYFISQLRIFFKVYYRIRATIAYNK